MSNFVAATNRPLVLEINSKIPFLSSYKISLHFRKNGLWNHYVSVNASVAEMAVFALI